MFNTIEPEAFFEQLKTQFAEKILLVEKHYDVTVAEVSHDVIKNVILFLKEQGFQFLTSCNGLHLPAAEKIWDDLSSARF